MSGPFNVLVHAVPHGSWRTKAGVRLLVVRILGLIAIAAATTGMVRWLLYGGPTYVYNPDHVLWLNDTSPLSSKPSGSTVSSWRLGLSGNPVAGWAVTPGVRYRDLTPGATEVVTDSGDALYALTSPTVQLGRGTYTAVLQGSISSGGLTLGVLDARTQQWIATNNYSQDEKGFRWAYMTRRFTLETSRRIQIVLANFRARPAASRWVLHRVSIVRAAALRR